jgi:protein ImuB
MAMGVRRGMPLGGAHRLAPEATFLDADPDADGSALEAALDRLAAFSPSVAGETASTHPSFGRIEVQIDGLDRLWGPEPVLVERIGTVLEATLPGWPRTGIAGTRFAALVAAAVAEPDRGGSSGSRLPVVVPPGGEADFLARLSAALLTGDPDVRGRLARFGLRRIGQVAAIPRSALVARFGSEGERLHAHARGEETDPFIPRRASERMALALPVEPAVEDLEPLRFLLHRLAAALADQLAGRGLAAGRAHLHLSLDTTFADRGTPAALALEQRLPEPTAEAEAIERLLFAHLERTPPSAPVARLELELADIGPAAGQQLSLFVPQAARAARLGWQLARLALTYGEGRIGRVELADPESPLAESRWRWLPVGVEAVETAMIGAPGPTRR